MKQVYSHRIDVFDVNFDLVLTDDLPSSYKKFYREDGSKYDDTLGLCIAEKNSVRVFLKVDNLTYDTIAHELYHATMAFHCRTGANTDKYDHELTAWINGYLNNLVHSDLKRAGVKPKLEKS